MEEPAPIPPISEAKDPILREDAAIAPPLSLTAYLLLGVHGLGRSRTALLARGSRVLVSAGGVLMPPVAGSLFLWLLAMPAAGRLRELGARPSVDGLLAQLGSWMGDHMVTVLLLLGATIPLARAAFDVVLFGRLRDAWARRPRPLRTVFRGFGSFYLLALIQLGLLVGGFLFLSPIIDLVLRMLVQESPPAGARFVMVVLVGMLALGVAWLRYVVMVIAAHLTWRPRFFAATVAAALAAPVVQWRIYLPVGAIWGLGYGFLLASASFVGAGALPPMLDGGTIPVRPLLLIAIIGGAGFVLSAWVDAVLVATVGHRLGDIASTRDAVTVIPGRQQQVAIQLAPEGYFPVGEPGAYEARPPFATTFEALLGFAPGAAQHEGWALPPMLAELTPVSLDRTAAGGEELVLESEAVARELAEPRQDESALPAVLAERRLSDLRTGRAVHRTAAGGREVVYRAASHRGAEGATRRQPPG